jgi:hypothetical protein
MLSIKISDFFCTVLRKRNPVLRDHEVAVLFEGRVLCATPAARRGGLLPGGKFNGFPSAALGHVELFELDVIELQTMRHFWMASSGLSTIIKAVCPDAKQDALDLFFVDVPSESKPPSSETSSEERIISVISEMVSDLGYECTIERVDPAAVVTDASSSVRDIIPAASDMIPDQLRLTTYKNSVLYLFDDESVESALSSIVHNPTAPWHQHVAFRTRPANSEDILLLVNVLESSNALLLSHLREIVTMWWERNALTAISKLDSLSYVSAAASLAKKKSSKASSASSASPSSVTKMIDMVVVIESEDRSLYTTTSEEVECPSLSYMFTSSRRAAEVEATVQYALRLIQRSCQKLSSNLAAARLFLRENFLKSIVLSTLLDWDVVYKPTSVSSSIDIVVPCMVNTPSPESGDQPNISPGHLRRESSSANALDSTTLSDGSDERDSAPPIKKRRGRPPKNSAVRNNLRITANETKSIMDSSSASSFPKESEDMVMNAHASSSLRALAGSGLEPTAGTEHSSDFSESLVESLFYMQDEIDAFYFFDS